MRLHLKTILMMGVVSIPATALAEGIVAVRDNGRVIYVNREEPAASATAAPASAGRQQIVYRYWSRSQRRWIRVKPASPSGRRARSAADEVSRLVAAAEHNAADANIAPVTSAAIEGIIAQAAARHNVDPNLVRAIVKVESNFNPRAVSRAGAQGLMQLMPATARELNVSSAFDPHQNVDAGVRHLKSLLADFNGDVELSLAAYNAGAGAVRRYRGVPPYSETRNYVKKITSLYWNGSLIRPFSVNGPSTHPRPAQRIWPRHLHEPGLGGSQEWRYWQHSAGRGDGRQCCYCWLLYCLGCRLPANPASGCPWHSASRLRSATLTRRSSSAKH
jgi:soluble lytic murein transglycosylase-like protein